jgi:membrane-associated phospholipid phosphatase
MASFFQENFYYLVGSFHINLFILKPILIFFQTCILLIMGASLSAQSNWETRMLRNIEANRTPGKTSFYRGISASTYVLSVATPLSFYISGSISGDKSIKKTALYLTESIALSQAISFTTKAIVNRERPAIKDPTFTAVTKANNASFPSGHTAAAFSLATSLSIVHPKWYVIIPSYTWAGLVGYSRLYLGVHYPTDVLAGAIAGAGSAWLSYRLTNWLHHSKVHKLKTVPGS